MQYDGHTVAGGKASYTKGNRSRNGDIALAKTSTGCVNDPLSLVHLLRLAEKGAFHGHKIHLKKT